jgi:hypothetical protein
VPSCRVTNTQKTREVLFAALNAQTDGNATDQQRAQVENLAKLLGNWDAQSLQDALNAAGIAIGDVAEGDAPALIKKLEEAAAKSQQAAVAATGLGDEMAKVAKSYEEAAKQAEVFASGLFIQQSSWIATLSTVDQFATSLDSLKYQTDFTAGALSGLVSNAQSAAQAAYTQAYAQAQLAGSTDAAGEASKAALDTTEQLRGQFISAAEAAGYSADQADTLATALFGVPGTIPIDIQVTADTTALDAAKRKLQELIDLGDAANANEVIAAAIGVARATSQLAIDKAEQDRNKAANDQAKKDAEGLIASNKQKQEADAARKQQEQDAKQAAQDAKRAADEAKRAAEEEQRRKEEELRKYLEAIKNLERASGTFQNSIEGVAKSLQQARDQFIGGLQERVQLSQGASVTRLIKNTEERNKLLTEVQAGVQQLLLCRAALAAAGLAVAAGGARRDAGGV